MPDLSSTVREALQIIALLCVLCVTLYKLASLYANTRRWNGLGKALRDEKWVYAGLWLWLLLRPYLAFLDHLSIFIALVFAVVWAEVRVSRYVPRVRIHDDRDRE